jgi:hypothetical protein
MRRWAWPAVFGVVTSLIGIAINLATEWKSNPWAWVVVAVLTGLGVVAGMRVSAAAESRPTGSRRTTGDVHNSVSAPISGTVIQAGSVGSINDHSVKQTAIANGGSTIHQAGRDIRPDGAP